MKKLFALQSHPSEDLLEEYAFRRLGEEQSANVEEHLLVCMECQEILAAIDEYALLMKTETAHFKPGLFSKLQRVGRIPLGLPRLAWAIPAAAACVLLALHVTPRHVRQGPLALISVRGEPGTAFVIQAPALRPLHFQIDPGDVPPGSYHMEISTVSAEKRWSGEVKLLDGKFQATVAPGLFTGSYWVRIYDQSKEMREFRLHTE